MDYTVRYNKIEEIKINIITIRKAQNELILIVSR